MTQNFYYSVATKLLILISTGLFIEKNPELYGFYLLIGCGCILLTDFIKVKIDDQLTENYLKGMVQQFKPENQLEKIFMESKLPYSLAKNIAAQLGGDGWIKSTPNPNLSYQIVVVTPSDDNSTRAEVFKDAKYLPSKNKWQIGNFYISSDQVACFREEKEENVI